MSRNIKDLHPRLQTKIAELKKKCKAQGIDIEISECLRTVEEQNALYAKGRTTAGSIVTNAKGSSYSSQHQWGIAADFYLDMDVDGDGKSSDDAFNNKTKLFDKVGKIAKSIGLGWGGDWTSPVDKPHIYLKDWGSTTTKLKKQYGTPKKFFKTWTPDEYTLKDFIKDVQKATGSKVDGIAGKETLANTITVSMGKNRTHSVVTAIERRLKALGYYSGEIEADHGEKPIFGDGMKAAVNNYQRNVLKYKKPDGEITKGGKMWKRLLGMI